MKILKSVIVCFAVLLFSSSYLIAGPVVSSKSYPKNPTFNKVMGVGGEAVAGGDNAFVLLPKMYQQGTGVLTNGTINTDITYMDDSPTGEWSAADPDMTATDDASYYKVGSKSYKVVVAATASAGDVICASGAGKPSNEDWTDRESVGFWLYSTVALSAGDFDFRITDGAAGNTDTDIPAISADTWTWVEVDISGVANASKDDVDGMAFVYTVDKGALSVYIDFLVKWDATDEEALDKDILKDGMVSVLTQDDDAADVRTWANATEYTNFFINYATSGNGNIVSITDNSDLLYIMLYCWE